MHPKQLSIADYSYDLPENKIAAYPLDKRDDSKLLIYSEGSISEDTYAHIATHLPDNSLLIFNDTRVVEARLLFQKETGGVIEIFCLEPHEQYPDITTALQQQGRVYWQCLVGGASKWKHGQVLQKTISTNKGLVELQATYVEKKEGSFIIDLSWSPQTMSFAELLHHAGAIPLPPYIKRKAEAADSERYQTVYAHFEGSVAAPTAGLHFTDSIFRQLSEKHIQTAFVTLHVGAGTFKPVKSATMETHEMHAEFIDVSQQTIETILSKINDPIIPVGTTSMRTLESLYWLGIKLNAQELKNKSEKTEDGTAIPILHQWDAYEMPEQDVTAADALRLLLTWMKKRNTERFIAKTQLLITPGYRFRIARALVTNFHQPQSTLLLLIAAFIGKDWRDVYSHALQNDFRFLSYGDGCLLWERY